MKKQLIIYVKQRRYELLLEAERTYVIGSHESADLVIEQMDEVVQIRVSSNEVYVCFAQETIRLQKMLEIVRKQSDERYLFYLTDEEHVIYYDIEKQHYLSIECSDQASIQVAAEENVTVVLEKQANKWVLIHCGANDSSTTKEYSSRLEHERKRCFYLNNRLVTTCPLSLEPGDELCWGKAKLQVYAQEIALINASVIQSRLISHEESCQELFETYPQYQRSPRILYRELGGKVVINGPEALPQKPKDSLLRTVLPPIVMMCMLMIITWLQPRGIYILMMVAMAVVTIFFAIRTHMKNRREYLRALVERQEHFQQYLLIKAQELFSLAQQQRSYAIYHYPSIKTISEYIYTYHHRIYEKSIEHPDFLHFRVGMGTVAPNFTIQYTPLMTEQRLDELARMGVVLYEQYRYLKEMPVVVNLLQGAVGYVGAQKLVLAQVETMIQQLACFHSYHELQMIVIAPEHEKERWSWFRWLPHAMIDAVHVRGVVYDQRSREQVLNGLYQILKERSLQLQNAQSSEQRKFFKPHYVIIVTDLFMVSEHHINEFLKMDSKEIGCSFVYVADQLPALPEQVSTVVEIKNRQLGEVIMISGQMVKQSIALEYMSSSLESLARKLAALEHVQLLKNSLPDRVTFLEMYGINKCEDLAIVERWKQHAPYKTLAVPIGVSGSKEVVELNVHEKAHGPHGLIAGTTGAGKSELLQTFILSLAINFHPHDVAFLLIDYKGGGMANLFQTLPHVVGMITNLNQMQSQRALLSIRAELTRRQRLFLQQQVNHIHQYEKRYKKDHTLEPLPHLFIIVDEFAELKMNIPEFIDELISIARVGRSLGIHLILATQKPSGVINEQIWSNSRFKIALKVAERQDSIEILKTPDAAHLTQAGRAYLQVGQNEVYELFQSAWSGAPYLSREHDVLDKELPFYRINELGQYEIVGDDLSAFECGDNEQVASELDAMIVEINHVVQTEQIEPLPRPWLPPLAKCLYLPVIHAQSFEEMWHKSKESLRVVIGMEDIPEQQAQEIVTLDLSKDGHVIFYGSPGYGKSTCLQTVTMDLVRTYNPSEVQFYLLDFGTNGLVVLKDLPHVIDWITLDERAKLKKLVKRLYRLIDERKQLLRNYSVANWIMYERISQQKLPFIVVMIDSFEGIRSMELDELEVLIGLLARDGLSVGIHLVVTAGRQTSLRTNLLNNFKIQIPLTLIDEHETRNIVGKTTVINEDLPGRGYVKRDRVHTIQIALPVVGDDELERIEQTQKEVSLMRSSWHGELPEPILLVPEEVSMQNWAKMSSFKEAVAHQQFPIGINIEEVETTALHWQAFDHLLVFAERSSKVRAVMEHIGRICQSDSSDLTWEFLDCSGFAQLDDQRVILTDQSERFKQKIAQWALELKRRSKQVNSSFEPRLLLVSELSNLREFDTNTINDISALYTQGSKVGLYIVIGVTHSFLVRNSELAKQLKSHLEVALVGMRIYDQMILAKSTTSREVAVTRDEVYLNVHNEWSKLKITKY